MKHLKLYIIALIGCITLTSCPSDGTDDIVPEDPTEEGGGDNTATSIEDIHNGTSNKPAYIPQN